MGKRVSERPWAVASLLLPWLAFAAQAQTNGAEPMQRESAANPARAATTDSAAPLAGWALIACDATQRTAVLRAPDGDLVLVREGDRFSPAPPPNVEPRATRTVPLVTVRQVLGDRLAIDLPVPADGGPDAAWIHVAAADGTSRVQYLRHTPVPPELHERPLASENPADGARRSSPRRPE